MTYKPLGASAEYKVHQGAIQPEGRLSFPGLEVQFTPEFLSGARGNKVELEYEAGDATFQDLRKNVSARPLGGTNFEIKLKDRDPWLVADILSTLQAEFLDVYYGTTEVQDVGILVQMEKDLALAKERLEKSQDELSHYYAEHPELAGQQMPDAGDRPSSIPVPASMHAPPDSAMSRTLRRRISGAVAKLATDHPTDMAPSTAPAATGVRPMTPCT